MGVRLTPPPYEIKAFTLAEVLITLVVIGIIAAITIPTITANHRREEVETRLKKFYTAFYNAHQLERINGNSLFDTVELTGTGSTSAGNAGSTWFQENIIDKHLSIAKYERTQYFRPPGANYQIVRKNVYCYNDGSCSYGASSNFGKDKYACIKLTYDINGEKGPNKVGRDQFPMIFCEGATPEYENYINKEYGTITAGKSRMYGNLHREAINTCKNGDNNVDWGACFYLIKNNGFKIPKDYPVRI